MKPEEENPDMVNAIVAAGGRIESVTVTSSSAGRCLFKTGEGECSNDHLDALEDSA